MAGRKDMKYKYFIHYNLLRTLNNASKTNLVTVNTNYLKKNIKVNYIHLKFQSVPHSNHTASRLHNPVIY